MVHSVVHVHSGKAHFYSVNGTYDVRVQVGCTCRFQSVQGTPNGKLCSHLKSVLRKMGDGR